MREVPKAKYLRLGCSAGDPANGIALRPERFAPVNLKNVSVDYSRGVSWFKGDSNVLIEKCSSIFSTVEIYYNVIVLHVVIF